MGVSAAPFEFSPGKDEIGLQIPDLSLHGVKGDLFPLLDFPQDLPFQIHGGTDGIEALGCNLGMESNISKAEAVSWSISEFRACLSMKAALSSRDGPQEAAIYSTMRSIGNRRKAMEISFGQK